MERKAVTFRLRSIDDDLKQAIDGITSEILSDLCRDGLRYMLGLKTTKRTETVERALSIPKDNAKKTEGIRGNTAVWKPMDKR